MRTDDDEKKPRFDTRKRIIVFVALILLTGVVLLVIGKLVQKESTTHYSYPSITTIEFDVAQGDVKLNASAGASVEIDAKSKHVLRKPSTKPVADNGVLKIEQSCPGFNIGPCNTDYTVTVPTGVNVKIESADSVDADGVRGDITAEKASVKGRDLYGRLEFETTSGSIDLDKLSSLEVKATTKSGKVSAGFDVTPIRVDVETQSGAVEVDVPNNKDKYKVDASSATGKLVVDVPNDASVDRTITARSESGDVNVR